MLVTFTACGVTLSEVFHASSVAVSLVLPAVSIAVRCADGIPYEVRILALLGRERKADGAVVVRRYAFVVVRTTAVHATAFFLLRAVCVAGALQTLTDAVAVALETVRTMGIGFFAPATLSHLGR